MNIPTNIWLPIYLKALFILSQTYKSTFKVPDADGFYASQEQLATSFKCFITTLINLVPDNNVKSIMISYLYMDETAASSLLENKKMQKKKIIFIFNNKINSNFSLNLRQSTQFTY